MRAAAAGRREYERERRRSVKGYVLLVFAFLIIVLAIQIGMLHDREQTYAAQEKALMRELEAQQEKSEDLKNYEAYTKTDEYTENMARSRGGLVRENEIIFREK